jgi:glycine/D-amino acid oxidase-like deaminating enzyme
VRIFVNTNVTDIKAADSQSSSPGAALYLSDQTRITVRNVVIAAGPFSQRVIVELFPAARINISMDTWSSSSNHIVVRTPRWRSRDDRKGSVQLFLQEVVGRPLDITSQPGGTLYVGGYGAEPEELPTLVTGVKPQDKAIDRIKEYCRRMLDIPEDEDLEVVRPGRCYRPILYVKGKERPIIAKVPVSRLYDPSDSPPRFNLLLNIGHGYNGMALSLGSGKVMSELIRGIKPSADISGLGYE